MAPKPKHAHVARAASPVEALLRDRVGPPAKAAFKNHECRYGHTHKFRLIVGAGNAMNIAVWELFCDQNVCKPERGDPHPLETRQFLHGLADDYRELYPWVDKLVDGLEKARNALQAPPNVPALPPDTAAKIATKLQTARDIIAQLDARDVPANPSILSKTVASRSQHTAGQNGQNQIRRNAGNSRVSICTKNRGEKNSAMNNRNVGKQSLLGDCHSWSTYALDKGKVTARPSSQIQTRSQTRAASVDIYSVASSQPVDDGEMTVLMPQCLPGQEFVEDGDARLIHGVIFYSADAKPLEVYFHVPRDSCFQFSKYELPGRCANLSYERYSARRDTYAAAAPDCNLLSAGRYVVYRKAGLSQAQCPGLRAWEQKSSESAAAARKTVLSSQPVASSSQATLVDSDSSPDKKRKADDAGGAQKRRKTSVE
ncbi:hypothetical protein R3P38DRAFT_2771223 [Favolaschia claudopus]|uniref:Uncharacterized protein n=1 Tax=Favolaschia claudopus TaxID=2862362 RepID=A0AAW0C9C5_9AGAR